MTRKKRGRKRRKSDLVEEVTDAVLDMSELMVTTSVGFAILDTVAKKAKKS